MTFAHPSSSRVRAVVSDVDGTLVTDGKILTQRARAAVGELRTRGLAFTIISSRPPRGMRMLLKPLAISAPFAAFNGGVIAASDGTILAHHTLSREVARHAVAFFDRHGIQTWLFTERDWLLRRRDAPGVDLERRTVDFPPTVVDDFAPFFKRAAKIVGVSSDGDLLASCEAELIGKFSERATVARSQSYYLDITHPRANKGIALLALAKLLNISPEEIAVIGDGQNDVTMFALGGLSIAMGNAGDAVKAKANIVTESNANEGFAKAIEQFVLPKASVSSG